MYQTIPQFLRQKIAESPEKVFLFYQNQKITYRKFLENVERASAVLKARGIKRGDKVAILLPNHPFYLYIFLGLCELGAIGVHLNTKLTPREVREYRKRSDAKLLIDQRSLRKLRKVFAQAKPFQSKIRIKPSDVCSLIFTSGTTGPPKIVMQTHQTYTLTGESFGSWVGMGQEDRLLTFLPLSHINAQAYSFFGALGAGAQLVLLDDFSASRFWETASQYKATEFNTVGPILSYLEKTPPNPREKKHKVRIIYHGGPLSEEKRRTLQKRWGVKIIKGYGLSESTFGLIEGRPRQHPQDPKINRMKLAQNGPAPRSPAEPRRSGGGGGEILLKNPAVMKGYYKDPQATSEALRGGWLHTGDIGRMDKEGRIAIIGRIKDMARLKGENVSLAEVEGVLNDHPAVLESAAIAKKVGADEAIRAYVVFKGKKRTSQEELLRWCQKRLAEFKIPGEFISVPNLPKTPTGRIAKPKLA